MKIAVTAASGQLGGAIVSALKNEIGATNVVGLVRSPERAAHLGVEVRKGDYASPKDFSVALKGIDRLLLVSGNDEPSKRIQQHRNVIEAAKSNQVRKIVYTSIIGDEQGTAFNPIVKSNRQTEEDVRQSGLDWAIGRNGIYIEPDLEYIDNYVKAGGIRNCAGDGRCTYTSREELAYAYSQILLREDANGHTFNMVGEPITQSTLVDLINQVFKTSLVYEPLTVEAYAQERKAELGDFLGTIIAGIYEGIRNGANDVPSDFEKAAGRPHKSPLEMVRSFHERSSE